MVQEQFYKEISDAIVNLDKDSAIRSANKAIDENMNLVDVIEKGFGDGIRRIGDLWEEGEFFLPELMLGGTIMQESMDILLPQPLIPFPVLLAGYLPVSHRCIYVLVAQVLL